MIAFNSDRTGFTQIFTMKTDGSDQKQLTTLGAVQRPAWQPIPMPTHENQCKLGGWKTYGFKNQWECIEYVNNCK